MEQRRRISVSISAILSQRLEGVMSETGLSESEIVRSALTDYIDKREVSNAGKQN